MIQHETMNRLGQPSRGRQIRDTALPYLLVAPPVFLVALLIFFPAIESFIRTLTPDDGSALSFARW